ncbi:hypothetical protein LPB19_12525 [Marinobacter salinisoli]|uniref:Uncharacterized protein n=1 Tax=Marinobacter salinisoli TaxID=2769486 RepID=A0ABX7MP95_9GAMM|nr:hypothetical protein [Marinobacter salinisoli]QSP94013.1 hypothetical protein LPB19_12525 [Marinobacter salinisoli]
MKRITAVALGVAISCSAFAGTPSKPGLCKGAIATMMYKDPDIMTGTMKGEEAFVSYTRSDGERFEMKCKFPKDGLIIWAGKIDGSWGRWRDKTSDSIVTYTVAADKTTFKENMGNKVVGSKAIENTRLQ